VTQQRISAVQLLAKIATVVSRQPMPLVRDGQFVYIKSEVAFINSPAPSSHLPKPHERQIWYSASNLCRDGMLREHGHNVVLNETLTPGVRCPDRGSLNDPTYRFLQSLPTGPRALLKLIDAEERGHGSSPAQEAFTTVGDLLDESIAPPQVSAALYRAAALIPGVTVVLDATDAAGRHGVAVAFAYGGQRSEWIFDRHTLQLLGQREISVRTGSVVGVSAILARAFVSRPGQLPPAS
jgi:hypothetical protein